MAVTRTSALAELARTANDAHDAGERNQQSAIGHYIDAGNALIDAKSQVGHGAWLPWVMAKSDLFGGHSPALHADGSKYVARDAF